MLWADEKEKYFPSSPLQPQRSFTRGLVVKSLPANVGHHFLINLLHPFSLKHCFLWASKVPLYETCYWLSSFPH